MSDMRDVYSKKKAELEKIIAGDNLSPEVRRIVRTAMELGYAAAFSSRTFDMNGEWYQAQTYDDGYKLMLKKLE